MWQQAIPPTPEGIDLSGRTVLVTGGNTGLGYEAARQFLTLKADRVVITARSSEKGRAAIAALQADVDVRTSNPQATIEFLELDLDSYESAMHCVAKIKKFPDLDIVLHNGGTILTQFRESKSGHEQTMQVNAYTPLLMSLELLPLLKQTAQKRGTASRLIFVGSSAQAGHNLREVSTQPAMTFLKHFDDPEKYPGFARYNDSKLTVNAYVRKLASQVHSSQVVINNLCPGPVKSGFDRTLPLFHRGIMAVFRFFVARSIETGARCLVHAAAVAGPETHGKFLLDNQIHTGTPWLDEADGVEFIDRIWAESVVDVAKLDPTLVGFI